ncbi:MAG TPA: hypothetical protein DIT28_06015, partial [Oxalobacteraceae bacterium]|nr:hypothetical protein [Oxalobacteraceae bacterium]
CIPHAWRSFRLDYRHGTARYLVTVDNPHGATKGVASLQLDGMPLPSQAPSVPLVDDGKLHRVHVVMGPRATGPA